MDVGAGDEPFDSPIAALERSKPLMSLHTLMKAMLNIDNFTALLTLVSWGLGL